MMITNNGKHIGGVEADGQEATHNKEMMTQCGTTPETDGIPDSKLS